MTEKNRQVSPYPLGAHSEAGGICVSFVSEKEDCGVLLYEKDSGKELRRIPFTEGERMGNIHFMWIPDTDAADVTYQFYEEGQIVPDVYARKFSEQGKYGCIREKEELKACFLHEDFDWGEDQNPRLAYEDCIVYCMHVRGFTRHPSSKVTHKGTFLGITQKMDYLKELGITTVELQPAYEFLEVEVPKQTEEKVPSVLSQTAPRLNYWGYRRGYYYTPKASYASGADACKEFKEMVKSFHQQGMEVVMQFYFPEEVLRQEIADILRFWVREYHVDGFHLMGQRLPFDIIASDPGLAETKLWYDQIDSQQIYPGEKVPAYKNIALYRDDYMYDMRRFLKGDGNMLGIVLKHLNCNPEKIGRINYLTNYYGFTMMDLVSYNDKHNEENGENNMDGNSFNLSWNCGMEGPCRKKQIIALRKKQYKNAMSLLFLSQASPLIFMGDEFGNSQKGNNNPYCQDNEITWLNWKDLEKQNDLYQFTKSLISLRKSHPILHMKTQLRVMDYRSLGYPDLSYHGAEAWRPSMESSDRQIGLMYCGKYAVDVSEKEDDFLYAAINMHWEVKEFAMPKLPRGMRWELLYLTEENPVEAMRESVSRILSKQAGAGSIEKIPPRSIALFISREIVK